MKPDKASSSVNILWAATLITTICSVKHVWTNKKSLDYYRSAIQAEPNNMEAHFGYALALLGAGNFLDGFSEFEFRWQRVGNNRPRPLEYPLPHVWSGEPLLGKHILIRPEGRFGDTFMFIRYAKMLKDLGAIVIAETHEPIAQLLSLCPYLDKVILFDNPLPPFDYQIPLLSLPKVFKTTLANIPASTPYLYAQEALIKRWHRIVRLDKGLKIGICWHGDPSNRSDKYMPFDYFAQLAQLDGVSVYSLHKNYPAADFNPIQQTKGTRIKQFEGDFDESHGGFIDTAALIKNMDLIITVDTSIAHLAGALGAPTWVILPFHAEWRWMTGRNDSPWYPTMRLFRQKKYCDWDDVFQEVKNALEKVRTNAPETTPGH